MKKAQPSEKNPLVVPSFLRSRLVLRYLSEQTVYGQLGQKQLNSLGLHPKTAYFGYKFILFSHRQFRSSYFAIESALY